MNTALTLETRVSWLEQKVRYDLSAKVDAMNLGISQIYKSNEGTRLDLAGLRAGLAHMETSTHRDLVNIKATLDMQVSEMRQDLGATEVSLRHDIGHFHSKAMDRFEKVEERFNDVDQQLRRLNEWSEVADERFGQIDQRFEQVDARFDQVDRRFDGVDQRLDGMETKIDQVLTAVLRGRGNGEGSHSPEP